MARNHWLQRDKDWMLRLTVIALAQFIAPPRKKFKRLLWTLRLVAQVICPAAERVNGREVWLRFFWQQ